MAENSAAEMPQTEPPQEAAPSPETSADDSAQEPAPSFVKLAMRNMVRKGGKSLFHFSLTATALMGLMVGLAYLTR